MTCETCDGTRAVAREGGFDSCPACQGSGEKIQPANDAVPPRLAPLVSAPPTMSLSAAVAACVASSYGRVRPRLVDPDEVTVVARLAGGAR